MDHYIDVHLREDPEFPQQLLMNALFGKLHRALVGLASDGIGVSFPKHDASRPTLGSQLRVHGQLSALGGLLGSQWLTGMRDHVELSGTRAVPTALQHRRVLRVQAKSSPERLRRRAMRRHGIDAEEARCRIPSAAAEVLKLPFVMIASASTAQPSFPLFIEHGPLLSTPLPGRFNSYGLSHEATVPWFA